MLIVFCSMKSSVSFDNQNKYCDKMFIIGKCHVIVNDMDVYSQVKMEVKSKDC